MKLKICFIAMLLWLPSCTSPSQVTASKSLDIGVKQSHSVFYDMSRIARQEILNSSAEEAVDAALAGDTAQAQVVVKDLFDRMNEIDWLHVQWERSRSFLRLGQGYVWGQRGVARIVEEEWKKAKAKVDARKPADSNP